MKKNAKAINIFFLIICVCALFFISGCFWLFIKEDPQRSAQKTATYESVINKIIATHREEENRRSPLQKTLDPIAQTPQYIRNQATWTAEAWDEYLRNHTY